MQLSWSTHVGEGGAHFAAVAKQLSEYVSACESCSGGMFRKLLMLPDSYTTERGGEATMDGSVGRTPRYLKPYSTFRSRSRSFAISARRTTTDPVEYFQFNSVTEYTAPG